MEWQEAKEKQKLHVPGELLFNEITVVHRGFTVDTHPFSSSTNWNPQRPHREAGAGGGTGGGKKGVAWGLGKG